MQPKVIEGGVFRDHRGELKYNNSFDASKVRRLYIIENSKLELKRGWKAHKIEQRWFIVLTGSFEINVVNVENFDSPKRMKDFYKYKLDAKSMTVLHCPPGHATLIQAKERNSKLLAMGDYLLGDTEDDYRFPSDYFIEKID